ncbi:hypothetical protein ACJVC5_15975 [Peredibacter sp. HCB2-198]|uniref:hypothetical protein n=1 Tax=Peredibacter sp. HCB2-198 TaxID=3383025 RepID=UPI0038B42BA2
MRFLFILLLILFTSTSWSQRLTLDISCTTPGDLVSSNVSLQEFQFVCQHLVDTDPACQRIVPENRMNCDKGQTANRLLSSENILSKVGQCIKGFLFDSLVDLGNMVVDLISSLVDMQVKSVTGMAKFLMDEDFRNESMAKLKKSGGEGSKLAMDFIRMSAAYFSQEFPKNLSDANYNPALALGKTLYEPLVNMLSQAAEGIAKHYISEYNCLNGEAKANTICKAVGSLIMPPTAIFAFLKGGKAALVALEATEKGKAAVAASRASFSKLNHLSTAAKLTDAERLAEASRLLDGMNLTQKQKEAIIAAHKIGIDEGRGFYTYTQGDISQKARLLREAGFNPDQTRLLMEKGITGTFANPNTTSLANGARVQGQTYGISINKLAANGQDVTQEMAKYKNAFKEAGENYSLAASTSKNPLILKMAWESSAKAGDVTGTLAHYQKGLKEFGMNQTKMMQGISQDILTLQRKVAANPKDPTLALELKTLKEVEAKLKGVQPPAAVVAKPATPALAPVKAEVKAEAKTEIKVPENMKWTEARDIANKYRLSRQPEEASHYYLKAAQKRDFSDRQFLQAFEESMKGQGTVAREIFAKADNKQLNAMLNEMFERELHYTKNATEKTNLRKILEDIRDNKDKKSALYMPQERMLENMLRWTKE